MLIILDFCVSAPYEENGVLYIYFQDNKGFDLEKVKVVHQSDISNAKAQLFGLSIDVFDYNNDGKTGILSFLY